MQSTIIGKSHYNSSIDGGGGYLWRFETELLDIRMSQWSGHKNNNKHNRNTPKQG